MVLIFFTALLTVLGQGPGNGISKDTRACSEGVIDSTFNFMLKYFPVTEAVDDCTDHTCTCGKQARVSLNTDSSTVDEGWPSPSPSPGPGPPGGLSGFGLHCVYAAGQGDVRVKQSGNKTQEQIEAVFQTNFNNMAAYHPYMEYNTGLFTEDISSFATGLKNGGVPFITLYWNDTSGDYVSVLVNPPKTTVVYEVVGNRASMTSDLLKSAKLSGTRFHFDEQPTASTGTMTPLWVSRATTDVDRDEKFFNTVFSGSTATKSSSSAPDGTSVKMLTVQMSSSATTKVRLVQPADPSDGTYSVAWWEDYLADAHKAYMKNVHCGWGLMGDNHNAYDWRGVGSSVDQADIIKGMDQLGYTYFCKDVTTPHGDGVHCYINTPYGYQMQLDGSYTNPPSNLGTYDTNHDLCATYMEYC